MRGSLCRQKNADLHRRQQHHADPREHRWPVMLGNQYQRLHRGLPFVGIVLGLGQLGDVERGVAERDQRLAARQYYRIEKLLIPRHSASTYTSRNES